MRRLVALWIWTSACSNTLPSDPSATTGAPPNINLDADADTDADADADADADGTPPPDPLEFTGTWDYELGGQVVITRTTFSSGGLDFPIVLNDNAKEWLIIDRSEEDSEGPSFTRVSWAETRRGIYICSILIDDDMASLASAPSPDDEDLSAGCFGTAWQELREPLLFEGEWAVDTTLIDFHSFDVQMKAESSGPVLYAYDAIHKDPDEPWMILSSSLAYEAFFTWQTVDDTTMICLQTVLYNGTETDASDFSLDIDAGDIETGCDGLPWAPLMTPLPIRGNWTSVDLLPTTLWETTALTELTASSAWIIWDVLAYDLDLQTMILHVTGPEAWRDNWIEVPPSQEYMKLQWHTEGDTHYTCILGLSDSPSEVASAEREGFEPTSSCGVSFMGSNPSWHPLTPLE